MATHQTLPDHEPPSAGNGAAAQALAASLRRTRLTLLCGEAGAGISALLVDGLLPALRRRGSDAAIRINGGNTPGTTPGITPHITPGIARRTQQNALPFPDRRSPGDRAAPAELVIFVNDWRAPSPASLQEGIDAALRAAGVDPEWYREPLAERLQSLGSRFGTRFLFVLDGFEAALRSLGDDAVRPDLFDELASLLNSPTPANLLIALRADAELLLAPLLVRLHTVRPAVLMLEGGRTRRVYGAASPLPETANPQAAAKPPPVELSQFDSARMPEAANHGVPTRPGDLGPMPDDRVERARPVPQAKAWQAPSPRRGLTARRRVAFASAALVACLAFSGGAVLLRAALTSGNYPPLEAATPAAPPPTTAIAALPPRPGLALQVDAEIAGTRLPRELAQALAADGAADVRIVPTRLAFPARGAGSPGLAVVRYDALQAASRAGTKPALAIVAPLYTEEIQVVVRADSPLRFIHQIEGRRINVGAAQGARALTARALYRLMFDRPLPATRHEALDTATALQRLAGGDGIDAVVLVGPQPAAALAALPPAQQRGFRLLGLAPDHLASRRALQTYLPATLRAPAGTGSTATTPTLAAMSFLVTSGQPDADTTATLGRLASSLCHQLPALQRTGDPKWRGLSAGLQLDTGWPPAAAANAAWRACESVGPSSVAPAATPSPAMATLEPKEPS